MNTTIATTSDVDAYTSTMPPPVRAKAEALFSELEAYRTAAAARTAREHDHAELMRQAWSGPKRDLVDHFIAQYKTALLGVHERFRCGLLRRKMEFAQQRGDKFRDEAIVIPDDRFLRKQLDILNKPVETPGN